MTLFPRRSAVLVVLLAASNRLTIATSDTNKPAGAATQASKPAQESPNELFVSVGKSVLVDSALPIERVSVGFGDVAEATAVSPQEVLVNGKAPGETSLIIWQTGGSKLFFDLTVQPSRYAYNTKVDSIRRQLSRELPGQNIDVSIENDLIFLRGNVKDLTSSERANSIASTMGKVVNLLYVDVPPPEKQVLLKVKFASVDRSLSTELGINIFSTGATNTIGSISTQQFPPPSIGSIARTSPGNRAIATVTTLSNALNLFFFRPDLNLGATIQDLQTRGLLEVLAEPNVLAENGKEASFLAGGEFPYPVAQGGTVGGTSAITIQFRQFGVRLSFIPTITPRGTIRLQVAPEVSALDYTNGITTQGFNVPGITVRNVNTEVELSEGQSFAIGGLLDNRETETFNKMPFIGDIPILGNFFKSKSVTKNNTELMVIVTPEIVHPMLAGQPLPELHYPVPFLSPNTGKPMETPPPSVTGSVPVTPPAPSIPVESLIKSMQPEKPLVTTSTTTGYGSNANSQSQTSTQGTTPP